MTKGDKYLALRKSVVEDLIYAIETSNRNLCKEYQIDKRMLKSYDQIKELAVNTEESMNRYYDLEDYLQTLTTFYAFLTDKNLSRDSTIFRFLINLDIDDMIINPDAHMDLFSEVYYSVGLENQKQNLTNEIAQDLERVYGNVLYDYNHNGRIQKIAPLKYTIPRDLLSLMNEYRLIRVGELIEAIKEKNLSYDPDISDDEDMSYTSSKYSSIGNYIANKEVNEDDDDLLSNKTITDNDLESYKSVSNDRVDNDLVSNKSLIDIVKKIDGKSSRPTTPTKNTSNKYALRKTMSEVGRPSLKRVVSNKTNRTTLTGLLKTNPNGIKIETEDVNDIEDIENEQEDIEEDKEQDVDIALTRTSTSLSHNSSNSTISSQRSDKTYRQYKCDHCKIGTFTHSWTTFCVREGQVIPYYFCSMKCMERWRP